MDLRRSILEQASEFTAFSGTKTFTNTTTVKWDVKFQKAGTTESASVQSFGLVFSDVDEDNSTSLEFFNGEKSIGKYFVPAHDATSSFSFLVNFVFSPILYDAADLFIAETIHFCFP